MSDSIPDVLVVGGGAVGLSVAYAAMRRGMSVKMVEREAAVGSRASWAGAGMLNHRPWPKEDSSVVDYHDLAGASIALHEQWSEQLKEDSGIDPEFSRCGAIEMVTVGSENAKALHRLERTIEGCRSRDVPVERIKKDDVAELEPNVVSSAVTDAIHLPMDAQVRNPRFLKAIAASCKKGGVDICEGVDIADIELENRRAVGVIEQNGKKHKAASVAVCAGAWTPIIEVMRQAAPVVKKIEPVRGQIVQFKTKAPLCSRLITVGDRYLVPRKDGVLLAGSTKEKVGYNKKTTPEGQSSLRMFAESLIPKLRGIEPHGGWADVRPGMKGRHPVIGPVPNYAGLFIAAGHYRNGLCLSPITGEVIAAYLTDNEPPLAIDPWLPKGQ